MFWRRLLKYFLIFPGLISVAALVLAVHAFRRFGPDEYFYYILLIFSNFALATVGVWSTNRIVAAVNDLKPKPKVRNK